MTRFNIADENAEEVKEFRYLDSQITTNGSGLKEAFLRKLFRNTLLL